VSGRSSLCDHVIHISLQTATTTTTTRTTTTITTTTNVVVVICLLGPLHVIVEYAPHGNLREFLLEHRAAAGLSCCDEHQHDVTTPLSPPSCTENVTQLLTLSYKDLLSFSLQVARGLNYMSSQMVNTTTATTISSNGYYCYCHYDTKRIVVVVVKGGTTVLKVGGTISLAPLAKVFFDPPP